LYVAAKGIVMVANARDGTLRIVDGSTFRPLRTVALGSDADNVRMDAAGRRVFVGYGSGALAALDLDGNSLGQAQLDGHPESFQLEKNGSRIFVNVPDAHHIAVIDANTVRTIARWPLGEYRANYPMALDEQNGRL